ncbi:MAG: OTU domain-containing protein, partial [Parachlamydiaceae bacterium]
GGGAGNVFIENIPETAKQTIKKEKGAQGEDGDPGAGGAGGAGKPDGLDCLYIKGGGWFFKKRQQVKGYELHCINNDKDREKESWKDGITLDATIRRNQGVAKDKGKKASEQNRRRNARAKNDLKRELFNTNLANHLHTKSAGSKAFAFNDVSDRLARAREAEETLQEELSVKQKKIRDIEHLQQTTSTLLQQTQAQKSAVIQHSRLAQFNKVHKEVNLKKEVEVFFKISAKDKENRLPFHTCSPVLHQGNTLCIHDLEVAMHGVNTTHGQNMHALAELIKEIILFSGEECLPEKRALLIKHLVDIIRKVPLRNAVKGFKSVLKAMKDWDVEEKELLQAVTEKHQQVVAFQADLDVQKLAVNQAFNDMVHEWTTQAALLKFLVKDNLLFKAQTKKLEITEKEQRLKWFQKRLYQKILFFMEKGVIDRSNKEIFFRFAMEKVEELELALKDDPSPSRRFREFLRLERKQIREKANNLKKQQEWLIQHLPEILEANTSSAELPKALLERLSSPEDVYVECSRLWAKIPSFNHENNVEDSLLPEEELPTREFSIKREGEQWESHLKQLLDLEKVLGDLDPYIVALDKIYSDSETKDSIDQGLADLFISLVDLHQKLDPCLEQLEEVKTNDLHKIYSLRLSYASSFSKKPHPFYANALGYLQRKNILLTKNECWENLRLLDDENEKKRVDSFLHEILLQADQLYRTMQFIEPIDFLTIAKEVLIEDPQRFLNDAVSSSEIYPSILQKAIKNDTLSCKDPQAMMKCFESALEHGEEKTVKTCLFVLLNISLSYAECTRVLTLLSKHKSYQEAFELFGYKIGQQKRFFEIKWKKALEAAKTYDHLRRQVDKEDQGSIVALLKTIAKEATLFSSDEQIDILETIVKTISQNGCFSTLDRLKALKKDLITKIGVFPIQDNPKITQYNQLLKDEKEELEKLSDAFLQVLEQPYQQEFLIPSLIAIQHLPFETKQLLVLYEIIQSFPKSSEGFRAVQKKPFFFTDYLISPEGIRHKKLLTAPDGNCLVHAVFGCPKSGVVLSNSSKKRKEIESRILQALSNQELPSHVKVKSFSPNNQVVEETINIRFLAQSIAKDGEWLGLDHAELIAYLYSLNILVYNERTKEYIGLFYNSDPNQIDRLISYNGINHWSKHQMITISEPISESKTTADSEAINTPSSPLSEKESEIKEDCLQTIRVLLINALQINCQTIQQAKRSTSTDLLKKKTDILQRARSIVENTQLLHTERHLAQFDLWMTLLDYHFDIDTFDDETGVKRQKLYEDALERLTHELGSYDSQEGIDHFHCWLRNTLSKIKGTDFSLDHLKVLLRETKSQGSSKQNASKNIKQGYWRGLLPYSSRKEEENSIVKVVEEA